MNIDAFHPIILNVGRADNVRNWNYTGVSSPFARMYCVTDGEARVRMAGHGEFILRPGHLYLIPPFARHDDICDGSFSHYYLHIYEDAVSGVFDAFRFPVEVEAEDGDAEIFRKLVDLDPGMELPEYDPGLYDTSEGLMRNLLNSRSRTLSTRMESLGSVLVLFSRFMAKAQAVDLIRDERINRSLDYIHSHLTEKISIDQLSTGACLSVNHFIRLFRTQLGCTPLQYIHMKRIEMAQTLLLSEKLSTKALSWRVGFDDPAYFIRVFRKLTGKSPMKYLREM